MARAPNADNVDVPPFETEDQRKNLTRFLNTLFTDTLNSTRRIGNYRFGVYAFYDYEGEPIYVGQTRGKVRTRIRTHLTNQRTDAVAMSVLDPFEVLDIEVWPLPRYSDGVSGRYEVKGRRLLDALESAVKDKLVAESRFGAVLNEKDPPKPSVRVSIPPSFRQSVVSEDVRALRGHRDVRIARRAQNIAKLAQVISERKVQGGLRRVLLVQAQRLQWLAQRRYDELGGAASVEVEGEEEAAGNDQD
jgi:GIY-YIG catalytic domain-containing protein